MKPLPFCLGLGVGLYGILATTSSNCSEDIIDGTFPLIKTGSSAYTFNDEAVYFPDDVWLNICESLEGPTLWNMGLANKHLGALLRTPQGFRSILKKTSPHELLDILASSDLPVYSYYLELFVQSTKWKGHWAKKQPDYNNNNLFSLIYKLTEYFQEKAGDWEAFYFFLTKFSGITLMNLETVCQDIVDDVYCTSEMSWGAPRINQCYYLPEPSERKLFDKVSPKLVAKITFSTGKRDQSLFLPLLLADYVIPSFKGELQLNPYEKGCLRMIFKHCSIWFKPYFARLQWSLFLLTGSIDKTEVTLIGPICRFLEDFGFVWEKIMTVKLGVLQACTSRQLEPNVELIYAVASHWNLDISGLRSSETVDAELAKPCVRSICLLMNQPSGNAIKGFKRMYLLDGELVSEASSYYQYYQESLKRKREEKEEGSGTEGKRSRLNDTARRKINLRQARDGSSQQ